MRHEITIINQYEVILYFFICIYYLCLVYLIENSLSLHIHLPSPPLPPPACFLDFLFLTTDCWRLPRLSPWARAVGRRWHCWAAFLQSAAWGCWEWQSAPTTGCTWRRASLCLWIKAPTSRPRCTPASGESASWPVSNKCDVLLKYDVK